MTELDKKNALVACWMKQKDDLMIIAPVGFREYLATKFLKEQ